PPSPFSLITILPSPQFPLFPYTTLFRSVIVFPNTFSPTVPPSEPLTEGRHARRQRFRPSGNRAPQRHSRRQATPAGRATGTAARSEEHTSELQSLTNLVCRLLLEKQKTHMKSGIQYPRPPNAHVVTNNSVPVFKQAYTTASPRRRRPARHSSGGPQLDDFMPVVPH